MLTIIVSVVIISFLVFASVYGPYLIAAVIQSRDEVADTERALAPLPPVDIEKLNAQLFVAFGGAESRELVDCTPYEHIEVEILDSELEMILEDDTLSTSQALAQISELLCREGK
jgi:hypothetical protein